MNKIKNVKLSSKGKLSYEWAKDHMRILVETIDKLRKNKPLEGITLGFCLHITKETSVLLMGAKELGAKIAACGANPLTTQDDIAAFLASNGINIYAWKNQTNKDYDYCIERVLDYKPDILTDDGADMNIKAHFSNKYNLLKIMGSTEETTAGVNRLKAISNKGKLRYPVIAVNNAYTKHMFDNKYGTGQSTIDGYLRSMNLLFASKYVVIVGYGWVGKGVSMRCRGMGSKVIVTEVNALRGLEAHMDGFDVMPMSKASKIGDIFITCTGMINVINEKHLLNMKNGAVVGNVGHFDVEIDTKFLLKNSKSVQEIRPNLSSCTMNNKKIYLIGRGRVANLVAAEGHPPEVMAQSFSNQILSILYILKHHKNMKKIVYNVPAEIDNQIATNALRAMDVKIDALTPEQKNYINNWNP
ncbi:MAG: adenosylhomocysteinase [Thaumarchaeota archaeon]|nr:adenosylhomocysteinase [Nitrososphaerota archaeon]